MGHRWTGLLVLWFQGQNLSGTDSPIDHPHPDGVLQVPRDLSKGQRSCTATECGACSQFCEPHPPQRPEAGAAFVGSDSPVPSTVLVPKMLVDAGSALKNSVVGPGEGQGSCAHR